MFARAGLRCAGLWGNGAASRSVPRWSRDQWPVRGGLSAAQSLSGASGAPTPAGEKKRPASLQLNPRDVAEVVDHVTRKRIRVALQESGRSSLHVSEFMELARRNGLEGSSAKSLLSSMHDAGMLLYMPLAQDRDLRDTVVLDSTGLTHTVARVLEMSLEKDLVREVKALEEELQPYQKVMDTIERSAKFHADLVSFGVLGLLATQFGSFLYLTFYELSWDIMEPITYFAGQVTVILTYIYFMIMKRDHTHEDLWNRTRRRRRERLFQERGLSYERFQELQVELARRQTMMESAERPIYSPRPQYK